MVLCDCRCANRCFLHFNLLLGLRLTLTRLLREGQFFNLLKASCVHIDDTLRLHLLLLLLLVLSTSIAGFWRRCCRDTLSKTHLAGVDEIPALILVVMLRLQPFLAKIAEVVSSDVRFGAIIRHYIFLKRSLNTTCLAYIE